MPLPASSAWDFGVNSMATPSCLPKCSVLFPCPWSLCSLPGFGEVNIVSQPSLWWHFFAHQLCIYLMPHTQATLVPIELAIDLWVFLAILEWWLLFVPKALFRCVVKLLNLFSCVTTLLLECHSLVAQATKQHLLWSIYKLASPRWLVILLEFSLLWCQIPWTRICLLEYQTLHVANFQYRWVWTQVSFFLKNHCISHNSLRYSISFRHVQSTQGSIAFASMTLAVVEQKDKFEIRV